METPMIAFFRIFLWAVMTLVGAQFSLWALGRDRWARRGDSTEWMVRLSVALVAARCMGWV
jgi:hypothetical protein